MGPYVMIKTTLTPKSGYASLDTLPVDTLVYLIPSNRATYAPLPPKGWDRVSEEDLV
jgi:hypothetical protein